jgi:PadR family transcriptional regulator AphA
MIDSVPMSSPRLGSVSYVVLGLIALRGPSTSYQLKRAVANSGLHEFWSFPHSQLYDEPARLAREGLLREEQEEGGRRRRVYSITGKGRAALRSWVRDPITPPVEYRDTGALKLFFGEAGAAAEDIVALALQQEAYHRDRLARYKALEVRFGGRPGRGRRVAPVRLGISYARAAAQFWASIAENPP